MLHMNIFRSTVYGMPTTFQNIFHELLKNPIFILIFILSSQISSVPSVYSVGPLQLVTTPVKNTLRALAVAWKTEFIGFIHKQAKVGCLKSHATLSFDL